MNETSTVPGGLRFFLAYGLCGLGFLVAFLLVIVAGGDNTIALIAAFLTAFVLLFALSRSAHFGDVMGASADGIAVLFAISALVWADSVTDLNDRISAFNLGAPGTPELFIDVVTVALLIVAALIAAIAIAHRKSIVPELFYTFLAANILMLAYALFADSVAGLPSGPNWLVPLASITLMTVGYAWAHVVVAPESSPRDDG